MWSPRCGRGSGCGTEERGRDREIEGIGKKVVTEERGTVNYLAQTVGLPSRQASEIPTTLSSTRSLSYSG